MLSAKRSKTAKKPGAEEEPWNPSPEAVNAGIKKWVEKNGARIDFLDKNPEVMGQLHEGAHDSFDRVDQVAWEERERMTAAIAVVEQLRTLPLEEAALKLLKMFDALCPSERKSQSAGRPPKSLWDEIDKEAGLSDGVSHNSQAAKIRADQRRRKRLGLERSPRRPKTRQE